MTIDKLLEFERHLNGMNKSFEKSVDRPKTGTIKDVDFCTIIMYLVHAAFDKLTFYVS